MDTDGGVKVLSEKTGSDENLLNCQDWSGIESNEPGHFFFSLKLHIRFQPIIRFRFRILTRDDGFPKFRV
jgi:hypothetical protein